MRLAAVCLIAMLALGAVAQAGDWWLGVSLGGTHLAGAFVEYRTGELGVRASLGTTVPWELFSLALSLQVRRYLGETSPLPHLGVGGWVFLVHAEGSWGWLTSLHVSAGAGWPSGQEVWELGGGVALPSVRPLTGRDAG